MRPFTAAATPIIPAVPTQAMAETQAPVQAPAGLKAGAEDTPPWEGAASKEAAPSAVPPPAQAQKPMPEPEQLAEQEPPAEAPLHARNRRLCLSLHLRLKKLHLFHRLPLRSLRPVQARRASWPLLPSGRR